MRRPGSIKLNTQISEEAGEWFIEFRSGDIDAAGRRAFDAWVRSSPEHLRAYVEIAAIWNESGALDELREFDTATLIAQGLAEANVVTLEQETAAPVPSSRRFATTPRWSVAAAVLIAFVGVVAAAWLQLSRAPTYVTEVGEQRSIRLADGSTVELNSRSRLRVRFTEQQRTVELLEGQALFKVAKNSARPFVVVSDSAHIRAVGTEFDVYKRRSGTVVTVVEGRVAVVGGGVSIAVSDNTQTALKDRQLAGPDGAAAVFLDAGEQITVTSQPVAQPTQVNASTATAWTQRQLVLDTVSLAEVAEEFNRYSNRRLTVEELATKELRLSGVFVTDPDFLIRYLRELPGVTVRETDTEIHIVHQ